MRKEPFLLCILDGVGLAGNEISNAVTRAHAPTLKNLLRNSPHSQLRTDGRAVGLPDGQMGNSEVGHQTIGSGRITKQPLVQITDDLESKIFETLDTFKTYQDRTKNSRAIHLMGLMSDGGVHSHGDHALEVAKIFNKTGQQVFVHAFMDGRDVPPRSGKEYLTTMQGKMSELENVHLASVIGRFYAMDRDNRWERVDEAWQMLTQGKGTRYEELSSLFASAYAGEKNATDEFIPPARLVLPCGIDPVMRDGDSAFFFNYRTDRARELTNLLLGNAIEGYDYQPVKLSAVGGMAMYDARFSGKLDAMYLEHPIVNTLGECMQQWGKTQLRIAETEKFAHVTFFMNSGRDDPYEGEDRILVDSPKVKTYDLQPEMSLPAVTDQLLGVIYKGTYDFIVLNIANGDMVGHTGDMSAAIKAVEAIDTALTQIVGAISDVNGQTLILADHGNVEEMELDGQPSTQHSTNPVPCIYYGNRKLTLHDGGLADVAPTVLALMDMDIPEEMTGKPLFDMG